MKPVSAVRGPWPVDLAHSRPFRIGGVEVRPASREVTNGRRREVLEPRVMEVLVVLAAADGAILSRDDLITACWGGRAVTDDAISRVISRLRSLGRAMGGFRVETITKVGYRLVEAGGPNPTDSPATEIGYASPPRTSIDRRTIMAGGAVAAIAGAGLLLWRSPGQHVPHPDAVELFRQAEVSHRQGFPGQARQTVSFYEQAVRIDPLYADAWGALALANTHLLEGFDEAELAGIPDRLKFAANRALALDPGNADAHFALALVPPAFGNWQSMEAHLRQLVKRFPDHWLGPGRLAGLLFDVGRVEEAIQIWAGMAKRRPLPPTGLSFLSNAMLCAGRIDEADAVLDQAQSRWPAHPTIWFARYKFLLFSGKPKAAAAFVADPESRPTAGDPNDPAVFLKLAEAADSGRREAIGASVEDLRKRAEADIRNSPLAATAFALLGRHDLSFAAWERYFLNRGGNQAMSRLTRRYTRELFSRPMAPLRPDPRFAALVSNVGLERYWRDTGTTPDYRRRA